VVYSPYGKSEKALVWTLLGLATILFVGNAVLTVKTYGDLTATIRYLHTIFVSPPQFLKLLVL